MTFTFEVTDNLSGINNVSTSLVNNVNGNVQFGTAGPLTYTSDGLVNTYSVTYSIAKYASSGTWSFYVTGASDNAGNSTMGSIGTGYLTVTQ